MTRLALLIIIALATPAIGAELPDNLAPMKLLGDETQLLSVKAEPQKHLGTPFIIAGGIAIDDYYNYGYSDKTAAFSR
jgi:hypothetical protein